MSGDQSGFAFAEPIRVAIFGVGLIGGSLALCFKGKPGITVIGHSVNPESVQKYAARGVVDEATVSLAEAAENADFLFLCVPVGRLEAYVDQLAALNLKPGCIVTDVGSTKGAIARHGQKLNRRGAVFIGGHPMAGSERSGVEAANSLLFENAYYVLTPTEGTPQAAVERLEKLLRLTKAQIIKMDADEHDEIVAAISHLPHLIAVGLVNQIAGYSETNSLYAHLAAGGFRDITRIASSDPQIWRDILIQNRAVLLKLLDGWQGEMDKFRRWLNDADGERIADAFRQAGTFRNRLPERRKGMLAPLYECYVDVPDHPGIVGKIATELGNARINLHNLQIIESREDVPGVLRLAFRDEDDLQRATELLKSLQFKVYH